MSVRRAALAAAAAAMAFTAAAAAQDDEVAQSDANDANDAGQTERIVIFGRALDLTGRAESASEGVVGYADFSTRPLLRVAELVEVMPGMIATQHSGGGKANQYFLRGFNLDHGTDFAGFIDGVPLNLRSHPHMNGYLDINFLIPEIVRTVDFQKGVHYADHGDFSAAGAAEFNTYDVLDQGFVGLDVASYDNVRALMADSFDVGADGSLLYALEAETNDGPWDEPEDLERYSGLAKYTSQLWGADFTLEGIGYASTWNATDQMPLRAVEQGLIGRFGTLDPDLGGATHRFILTSKLDWDSASLQVYVQNYALDLYQNPTFFLDQVNGDQFVQVDRRWSYGAKGRWDHDLMLGSLPVDLHTGADLDYQDIGTAAVIPTIHRVKQAPIRDDSVDEVALGVFADVTVHFTDKLRTTFGARSDSYWYDVRALRPENSNDGSDAILSPKFSSAYAVTDALELYVDYGQGFHSNDARGAAARVDPTTGDPVDPSDLLVKARGGEVGLRFQPSSTFNISADYFKLDLDSELIFSGDAGTSEPSSGTERRGVEVNTFWRPRDWLALDASAAWSHARFADAPSGEDRIPNSLDFAAGAGATIVLDNGLTASLRLRHQGESALIEDNSARSKAHTDTNFGISYDFGPFQAGLDVLNVFDDDGNDISYYYESQLQGEPAPVADYHFHPQLPRTFRLVLKADF